MTTIDVNGRLVKARNPVQVGQLRVRRTKIVLVGKQDTDWHISRDVFQWVVARVPEAPVVEVGILLELTLQMILKEVFTDLDADLLNTFPLFFIIFIVYINLVQHVTVVAEPAQDPTEQAALPRPIWSKQGLDIE